jgi:hypothetical protein
MLSSKVPAQYPKNADAIPIDGQQAEAMASRFNIEGKRLNTAVLLTMTCKSTIRTGEPWEQTFYVIRLNMHFRRD